jgi:hypothetical protein
VIATTEYSGAEAAGRLGTTWAEFERKSLPLISGVQLNVSPSSKVRQVARWTRLRKEVSRMKMSNVGSKLPVAMTKAN